MTRNSNLELVGSNPAAVGTSLNPRLTGLGPQTRARLRLFCFPYAGGTASAIAKLFGGLSPDVSVCSIELPGRGSRLSEQPVSDLAALVEIIAADIEPFLDRPFAFFGHSMGTLLSFELARWLRRKRKPGPVHLLVSAGRAPQIREAKPVTGELLDHELVDKLRRLNGTPQAVLDNPELMALVLPIVRADLTAIDNYLYTEEPPLECPITAFGGLGDLTVTRDELARWRDQTTGSFTVRMLPGDHFFLNGARLALSEVVGRELRQYC
jgi:surfactin synthase thioesterase subunit